MKEFKCKKCKEPIGLTDGNFLYAGGFGFPFKTTGTCLHCGQMNCWRPLHGKNGGSGGPEKIGSLVGFVRGVMDEAQIGEY
jgi:hypothetical protein